MGGVNQKGKRSIWEHGAPQLLGSCIQGLCHKQIMILIVNDGNVGHDVVRPPPGLRSAFIESPNIYRRAASIKGSPPFSSARTPEWQDSWWGICPQPEQNTWCLAPQADWHCHPPSHWAEGPQRPGAWGPCSFLQLMTLVSATTSNSFEAPFLRSTDPCTVYCGVSWRCIFLVGKLWHAVSWLGGGWACSPHMPLNT